MTWGMIAGAAISTVGGALLADDNGADDNGAEGMNDSAAEMNRIQAEIGKDQWDRYKSIYGPIEEQWIDESQGIDSFANQNKAAQQAGADVAGAFAGARDKLNKNAGIDPGSQAYLQEQSRTNLAEAAASAAGQTGARQQVRDKGRAAVTDIVQLGKGLPATASSSLSAGASGLAAAGRYAQGRADDSAAGFGKMVGGITGSDGFKKWLNSPSSNTPAGGYTAPGGSGFGMDIGFEDPLGA
jgi:hypothetical protein